MSTITLTRAAVKTASTNIKTAPNATSTNPKPDLSSEAAIAKSAATYAALHVPPPLSHPPQFDPTSNAYIEQYKLPFDLPTIRSFIPAQCFQINTLTSIYYYLKDMTILISLYLLRNFLISLFEPNYPLICNLIIRPCYWMCEGFFMWCLFVVGHDCGHGTFSTSYWINSLFGHLSHSVILVPFHGWQSSHRAHHLHHNDIDHDHSWKPYPLAEYTEWKQATLANNPFSFATYILRFTVMNLFLYPIYLLTDSPKTSGNHFNPFDKRLFTTAWERFEGFLSTTSVLLWLFILGYSFNFQLWTLIDVYFIPYLIFVAWLDVVTYLHHTSSYVTYYRGAEWSYLKGGLSTVDRSYGSWLDEFHHNIGTHIIHHLFFTKIPHYHLKTATEGVRKLIGPWMVTDERWFGRAFWENITKCKYVDDEGQVCVYKNEEDLKHAAALEAAKKMK